MANPENLEARKGRGRPKGSKNKVTAEAKAVIAAAAEELGGQKRLVTWAKADPLNERAFWATIYPKLLPLTVAGDKDNPLHTITKFTLAPLE
ncbi:hypothetical protein ACYX7E_09965 [Luteimonas sp. RIT-PG2_3]